MSHARRRPIIDFLGENMRRISPLDERSAEKLFQKPQAEACGYRNRSDTSAVELAVNERDIFHAAMELSDPAERSAYLEKACAGDATLKQHVEGMLQVCPALGKFLEAPAADLETLARTPEQVPSDRGEGDVAADEETNDLHFLQPASRADSLGRIGHYEVLEVVGKGGFGIVLRALDELLQRVVALKVLAPAIAATSPARKRFLREARSSAQVRHENVVQVYAVEEQPLPYLVMEFVPGQNLQQRLDGHGPLETPEIVRLGLQIAEGLDAAHATGLIHRDIKPGNILIEMGTPERVKITDFGLARAADDASLTQSGMIAGTPMYMAPEQARGETLDHRADLFSLGSVLYVMATGRPPFRAATTFAVLKRVVEEEPRPIQDVIPEVPPWLCKLIARLHAKKREERFATAREVADLLERCRTEMQRPGNVTDLVDKPVPVPDPLPPSESRKGAEAAVPMQPPAQDTPAAAPAMRRRSRRGRWAAAAVLLLLLGGLSFTEAIGVTDCRSAALRLFALASEPSVEPQTPPDAQLADAGAKGRDLQTVPDVKKDWALDAKQTVAELPPPAPSIHDNWIAAFRLLPLDKQGAAVAGKMKEQLPGFYQALLKAIPAMSADTKAVVVDVWLKERQPAFAGLEDAWLKVIPVLPVDTQVVLLAAWLKERNPGFDGSLKHQPEGTVIASLEVPSPFVQDLLPLRALSGLKTLICRSTAGWDNKAESDAAVLLSLKALTQINGKPVAQFWKDVQAKRADFNEWLKLIPSLTAKQQADAVAARIKEHNPDFVGKVIRKIDGDVVTELTVFRGNATDLSPVRALIGLRSLGWDQKEGAPGILSDLSPLKDMKLTSLVLRQVPVSDLSPLKDMKLTSLSLIQTHVSDLAPLKDNATIITLNVSGLKLSDLSPLKDNRTLTTLNVHSTKVTDLSPLKDTLLTSLNFGRTGVKDLSPLKGLKLTTLKFVETGVEDLSPLKGMALAELNCRNSKVTDLSPLKDLPLTKIDCDFQPGARHPDPAGHQDAGNDQRQAGRGILEGPAAVANPGRKPGLP